MNLEKIETLVAFLAKSGDRETISTMCELLNEVSKFKKKGDEASSQKVVTESVKLEPKSHAALILEGIPDNYSSPSNTQSQSGSSKTNSDMMSHAALLF